MTTQCPAKEIPLDNICLDGMAQCRAELSERAIAEYAECVDDLPPGTVFHDGSAYWLADGFHRYFAHDKAGKDSMPCHVRRGTRRDAILFALGANENHGLRRTPEDRRKAVLTLLEDEEWAKWSVNQIAQACRVSWDFANKVITSRAGSGHARPAEVTYTDRHGTTTTMDTSRINKKPVLTSRAGSENDEEAEPGREEDLAAARPAADNGAAHGQEDHDAGQDAPPPSDADSDVDAEQETHQMDGVGVALPNESARAFQALDFFDELESLLKQVEKRINELAQMPGGEDYRRRLKMAVRDGVGRWHSADVSNAKRELNFARPFASVCPYCRHEGKPNSAGCKACGGLPYVTADTWDRAPQEYRDAITGGDGRAA